MANVFFISDLHFGHKSFLPFRKETHGIDFKDEQVMNEWIIESINSVVRKKRDMLWILGDIAWGSSELHNVGRLNGTKKLIIGNHDKFKTLEYHRYFEKVHGACRHYGLVMTHVPIHPSEMKYRNWSVNVHGHIHHKERDIGFPYINVNMDIIGPKPISLDEIREIIKQNET